MASLTQEFGYYLQPLAAHLYKLGTKPPKGWMALADLHDGSYAVVPSGVLMRNLTTGQYAMFDGAVHTLDKRKVETALSTVELDEVGRVINAGLPPRSPKREQLASALKAWRKAAQLNRAAASDVLGIPARTIERIEQQGTFPYPILLTIALQAFGALPTEGDDADADDDREALSWPPAET